jgi:P-type E1-E2 ATPase
MIDIDIPSWGSLRLEHLVCDYNGTLATNGNLIQGIGPLLSQLAQQLTVHVVTGDSFGTANAQLTGLRCHVHITPPEQQGLTKLRYVQRLSIDRVVAIGNGCNDRPMLEAVALGIAIIGGEGAAAGTVVAGDIVVSDILCALELLLYPARLRATLRG